MRKFFFTIMILCACSALCSCTAYTVISAQGAQTELTPLPTLPPVPTPQPEAEKTHIPPYQSDGIRDVSCWSVYWDTTDTLAEIFPYSSRLGALCYFEAFFDETGAILLPEEVTELYDSVETSYPENKWDSYITFVNDMQMENGEFELKSTSLIAPFLADEAAMDEHIEALIAFTEENGFDGIEIDYEALRKAPELWQSFTVFCERLYERTQEESLGLRIVLEPYAPFEEYSFPNGPTYVIMCYNLHGAHNGPGPKADLDFLADIAERSSALPSKRIFALATGGYDWDENGDAVQVTLRKAYELYVKFARNAPVRDEKSSVLSFEYKDEAGQKHSIWCADTKTLETWSEYLRNIGISEIAYWRLGGNYLK